MIKQKDNPQESFKDNLLPHINKKLFLLNDQHVNKNPILITDKLQQFLKDEKEKIKRQLSKYQQTQMSRHLSNNQSSFKSIKASRSTSLIMHKFINMKKMSEVLSDRYMNNQRLSKELKLPKENDHYESQPSSEEQHITKGLLQEDHFKEAIPQIYVMTKNASYNLIKAKEKSFYLTDEDGRSNSKMEITQNNQYFPSLVQISMNKTLNPLPTQEKYIKEKFVGKEAVSKFYDKYKNIQKIRQMQNFRQEFNPITAILTILQHYNIPPKRMQVIKIKGQEAILDLRNCGIGRGVSIKAISEIIQKVKVFEQIDLSYNSIHTDLCDLILPNLSTMRRINLSYNKIGRRGMEILSNIIYNEKSDEDIQIEELNLESNSINDTAIGPFFSRVIEMNYLMILNLSKNFLGNYFAQRLKQFLIEDNNLTELYLHWTQLGHKATKLIFQGLTKNYCLRVLDLSWNQIGLDGTLAFCNFVKSNDTLIHLDISFCQIDQIDTKKIANALKHNRTIYGLHYQGNLGLMDYKGYLNPIKKENKIIPFSIRAGLVQRIDSINIQRHYYSNHNENSSTRNICWICQGWQEKYFKISKNTEDKLCFIHFDFQKYNGVLMVDKNDYFEIIRMCPPKELTFFYTKVSVFNTFTHQHIQKIHGQTTKLTYNTTLPEFSIQKNKFSNIFMPCINKIPSPKYYNEIFNEDYLTKFHCMPRTNDIKSNLIIADQEPKQKIKSRRMKKPRQYVQLQKQIRIKEIPESFVGIFNFNKNAGEGQEYRQTIRNCVEFDVSHSKVSRIIKNETDLKQIKGILQANYDLFQKIYYYLNNNNPNTSGVFSISELRFQKFIEEQHYETKRVTLAKITLKLMTCLSNQQGTEEEINGFYRPQLFQFLLRLAMEKWCQFIQKKQNETQEQRIKRQKYPLPVAEAFGKIIKSLKKYLHIADPHPWREENLTTYEINIVLKSYTHVLQRIYEKYAGNIQKNMNTKVKKKLLLDQFKTMCLQAGIRKTKQAMKDLEIAYRTAKNLQVQDGISDTGINYIQFLQAFCRFAEGIYLKPIGSDNDHLWQQEDIKLDEIPLFLKVQKLIQIFYNRNYDIKSKKTDILFQSGLFPQEVNVLMKHYSDKYSQNKESVMRKTKMLKLVKMNSLSLDSNKITLKFLISLLKIKAEQIQEQNKQKMMSIEEGQDDKQESDEY